MVTLILAVGFLGLWFLFAGKRRWNVFFGLLFFIFLIANFILTVGFAIGPMKYIYFSRNLLLISGFGFVFNLVKHNKAGLLGVVTGSVLLCFKIFSLPIPGEFITEKVHKIADAGELLVIPNHMNFDELKKVVKRYDAYIVPAFRPRIKGTALDDFFIIDIPDDIRDQQKEILDGLLEEELILYGEFNDRIQIEPSSDAVVHSIPSLSGKTDDPLIDQQWAFETLGFDKVHQTILSHLNEIKRPIKVMILDTGIEGNHEDLTDHIPVEFRNEKDPVGHGSHCAGIIGASTNNNKGIASMIPVNGLLELIPVKVLNSLGYGTQVQIINGMIKAVDAGGDILSMSLGGPSDHPRQKAYKAAVDYASLQNAVVVVSAGNSNAPASKFSPANVEGVICVTATDSGNKPAPFSNYLDSEIKFGIAAPGVQILSTFKDNQYKALSGTSMSAPFVTSVIALMKAFDPQITTKEIYSILYQSARPTSEESKTGRLIQPNEALLLLLNSRPSL